MEQGVSSTVVQRVFDPEGWSEQHGAYLLGYALRYARDRCVAQDLVQETWLAAWEARGRFAGQSSERTWLIGILRHKVIDYIRKVPRERRLFDASNDRLDLPAPADDSAWPMVTPAVWSDPSRQLERKQLRAALNRCLCRLSERMKTVFAFCDLDEVPHREVARTLGVTDGHLSVLLHRARRKVRECLSV